jgi:hypothetical protein
LDFANPEGYSTIKIGMNTVLPLIPVSTNVIEIGGPRDNVLINGVLYNPQGSFNTELINQIDSVLRPPS